MANPRAPPTPSGAALGDVAGGAAPNSGVEAELAEAKWNRIGGNDATEANVDDTERPTAAPAEEEEGGYGPCGGGVRGGAIVEGRGIADSEGGAVGGC